MPSLWDAFGKGRKPYVPPPENKPALDASFYVQVEGLVPADKTLTGKDIPALNVQQSLRDEWFKKWISRVADDCEVLGWPMVYSLVESPFNFYDQPITCAVIQFPTKAPTWAGAVTPKTAEDWTPGVAANTLIGIAQGG